MEQENVMGVATTPQEETVPVEWEKLPEIQEDLNEVRIQEPVEDVQLTALVPDEMLTAQTQLIEWCDKKIASIKSDADELLQAYEHAKKSRWKTTTLKAHHSKALKRLSYYEKIKAALENGYHIVPNFPVQLFAIKTKKDNPERVYSTYRSDARKGQRAQEVKMEEGEYKNPFPLIKSYTWKNTEGNIKTNYYPSEWDDMEFPITMAKPVIMEAVSKAMEEKVFDQIGIMPATKNEDPVIIGQIVKKAGGYSKDKIVSFMIAWHLNTKDL